jgi:glycosyltransferase involved in cell wall biosynthesis
VKINWLAYYAPWDGYGRYNSRLVAALERQGVTVAALTSDNIFAPDWLHKRWGVDWDNLTISCFPPNLVRSVPGRHWLMSMTEGSVLPDDWADIVNKSNVERVIVPCQHSADAFQRSGIDKSISIVAGGTDPLEFPLRKPMRRAQGAPAYTFLCFADRGSRKGYFEIWDAFYLAFGGKTTGVKDVRLIVKSRPTGTLPETIAVGQELDPRVIYQIDEADDMRTVYEQADCLVIPSRCEGWGMPHREAAMMGLPVITQAYSGMDDGHTHEWAYVVEGGRIEAVSNGEKLNAGEWLVADTHALAAAMKRCYDNPLDAAKKGQRAAQWLRANQTWDHSAQKLIGLIKEADSGRAVDSTAGRGVSANGTAVHAGHLPGRATCCV